MRPEMFVVRVRTLVDGRSLVGISAGTVGVHMSTQGMQVHCDESAWLSCSVERMLEIKDGFLVGRDH